MHSCLPTVGIALLMYLLHMPPACRVLAASEQFVVLGADPAVPDSYQVLGLPLDATSTDIKRKLHKLRLTVRYGHTRCITVSSSVFYSALQLRAPSHQTWNR